ncbi:MAG: sigma-70 family RNA polymerase sigma factor [Gemmataceae bacterium]|jgi:RNA polymerase sigma-70 factor (ECF subfamily)|nr:sigma-70 family RNA polymerase sigma factor [Gemmataceae bacterium]
MHAPEPDELLMAQVAGGRGESLAPLVGRYAGPLVTFLHRMTGDRHRAEDLFQDTFLAVWRKRGTYRWPRPFKPWLYAIAMNTARAAFRSAKPMLDLPAELPTPPADGPPLAAVASETSARIARVIDNLPTAQRAVVALRVGEGLSYSAIAEAVGITEATVRSHMSHALAVLRERLPDLNA